MQSSTPVKFQVLSAWHKLDVVLRPLDGYPHPVLGHLGKNEHPLKYSQTINRKNVPEFNYKNLAMSWIRQCLWIALNRLFYTISIFMFIYWLFSLIFNSHCLLIFVQIYAVSVVDKVNNVDENKKSAKKLWTDIYFYQ